MNNSNDNEETVHNSKGEIKNKEDILKIIDLVTNKDIEEIVEYKNKNTKKKQKNIKQTSKTTNKTTNKNVEKIKST
jgi:hypothetical protein